MRIAILNGNPEAGDRQLAAYLAHLTRALRADGDHLAELVRPGGHLVSMAGSADVETLAARGITRSMAARSSSPARSTR